MFELVAYGFIVLHNLSGQEVIINTDQITAITPTRDDEGKKLLTDKVQCVIGFSNGKFVTVVEKCDDVRRKLEDVK